MDEQELLARYALALALVPDANVAGDLFAAAADDADLRRRAGRWRRRHGLPPVTAAPALAALSPEQCADARHLWAKARRQRRLRPQLWAAAVLVVLLGALLGGRAYLGYRASLPSDPAFAGGPLATSAPVDGLRLSVYRAVATPSQVSVWWEVKGPGARRYAGRQPTLLQAGNTVSAGSQRGGVGPNRVQAVSTYRMFELDWTSVRLVFAAESRAVDPLAVAFSVQRADDPETIVLRPAGRVTRPDFSITPEAVRRSPASVSVSSLFTGAADGLHFQVELLPIQGGQAGAWLREVAHVGEVGRRESFFAPLPPGTTQLLIRYLQAQPMDVDLNRPPVESTHRSGRTFTATVRMAKIDLNAMQGVSFITAAGVRYPIDTWSNGPYPPDQLQQLVQMICLYMPPDQQPVRLIGPGLILTDAGTVNVNLP